MSRLPSLNGTILIKILKKQGFFERSGRGSHVFLKHHDGRTTTVPVHKGEEIGRGLLRKILRDVKLEPQDFLKLL